MYQRLKLSLASLMCLMATACVPGGGGGGDTRCFTTANCGEGQFCDLPRQKSGPAAPEARSFKQDPVECIVDCQERCDEEGDCANRCIANECFPDCGSLCTFFCEDDAGCTAECLPECASLRDGGGGAGGEPGPGGAGGEPGPGGAGGEPGPGGAGGQPGAGGQGGGAGGQPGAGGQGGGAQPEPPGICRPIPRMDMGAGAGGAGGGGQGGAGGGGQGGVGGGMGGAGGGGQGGAGGGGQGGAGGGGQGGAGGGQGGAGGGGQGGAGGGGQGGAGGGGQGGAGGGGQGGAGGGGVSDCERACANAADCLQDFCNAEAPEARYASCVQACNANRIDPADYLSDNCAVHRENVCAGASARSCECGNLRCQDACENIVDCMNPICDNQFADLPTCLEQCEGTPDFPADELAAQACPDMRTAYCANADIRGFCGGCPQPSNNPADYNAGALCQRDNQCRASTLQAVCLTEAQGLPGGYCAGVGCNADECGPDGICLFGLFEDDTLGACFAACVPDGNQGQSTCRAGYVCAEVNGSPGDGFCIPPG